MARREIVAAVDHHVGIRNQLVQQLRVGTNRHGPDPHQGIDPGHRLLHRSGLALPETLHAVGDLPLQIGEIDAVVVDHRDAANPGGSKVKHDRGSQPAGADDQSTRTAQPPLAFNTDFVQQDVARITQQLVVGHGVAMNWQKEKPAGLLA